MADRPSLIILGFDGAGFPLLDPWIESGELPVLKGLIERGTRSPLLSTPQAVSPPSWTTIITGQNPGKHGIFFFFRPRPEDYRAQILNATHRRARTVWQVLNAKGLRVGVIGVPMTYPPEHIDAFEVSGFDAPNVDASIAWPPGTFELLREHLGEDYDHRPQELLAGHGMDWARVQKSVTHRTEAGKLLAARYKPDVLMVVYSESDAVQHYYMKTRNAQFKDGGQTADVVLETYRLLDAKIGELLADTAGPETSVILLSDHGAGPIERELNIDTLLFRHGFLKAGDSGVHLKRRALLAARRLARGILGNRLADRLSTRFAEKRKELAEEMNQARVDFSRSRAFPVDTQGGLRLNLAGREAQGCVKPEEREAVERELRDALLSLRDPVTGEQVFTGLSRGDELFSGPETGNGPDLVAERDYKYALRTTVLQHLEGISQLEGEDLWHTGSGGLRPLEGSHRPEGIFVASGPAFARGARFEGTPGVQDVAPTILHLLGLPVPDDMDGRALEEVFAERRAVQREASAEGVAVATATYSDEEQAEVEGRLRALGYM